MTLLAATFFDTNSGFVLGGGATYDSTNKLIASNGSGKWWYFSDSAWSVGTFNLTYSIFFPSSASRDIANLAFWTTDVGASFNTTADGYMLRLDTGDGGSGFYQFTNGTHGTAISSTAGVAMPRNQYIVVELTGNATTGRVRAQANNAFSGEQYFDIMCDLPAGNRFGTFGQKQDGAGAAEGHQWDGFFLNSLIGSPKEVSGLIGWYAADSFPNTYVDDTTLTSWPDLSGNNNHLASPTGLVKYRSAQGWAGGKAVQFSEGVYYTLGNVLSGSSGATIMATIRSSDSVHGFWKFGTDSGSPYNHYPHTPPLGVYDDFGSNTRKSYALGSLSTTNWRRYQHFSGTNNWGMTLDNIGASGSTNTYAPSTAPQVGNVYNGAASTMYFGGIVLYNRVLTNQERSDVNKWLFANPSGGSFVSISASDSAAITVGDVATTVRKVDKVSSPKELFGNALVAWYSADNVQATGLADGGTVTQWKDISGNGNHSNLTTGTPLLRTTAGKNSGPALEFGSATYYNFPNMMNGLPNGEVIGFVKALGTSANLHGFWKWGTDAVSNLNHYTYSDGKVYDDFGTTARRNYSLPSSTFTNTWRMVDTKSASNDWVVRIDNAVIAQAFTNTVAWTVQPKLGSVSGSTGASVQYGAVIVVNRQMNDDERLALYQWYLDNPSGGNAPYATDGGAISVAESSSIVITNFVTANDTAAITVTDASTSFRTIVATDTTAITATDASGTMVKSTTSTDTTAITVTDAAVSPRVVSLTRTDTAAITVTDASGTMAKSSTRTDGAAITVSDVSAKQANFSTTDTTALTITETSTLYKQFSSTDTTGITITDAGSVNTLTTTVTGAESTSVSAAEASQVTVLIGQQPSIVTEDFSGGMPADVVKGSGVSIASGAIISTGDSNGWWYFTDPKWVAGNSFTYSVDVFAATGTREIANIAFWITSPGATADGYMLRVDTATSGGFFKVTGGNHSGNVPGSGTWSASLPANAWYRVIFTVSGDSMVSAKMYDVATLTEYASINPFTFDSGNRSGTFGRKQDGLGGPGSSFDNIVLNGGALTGSDVSSISVTDSGVTEDLIVSKSASDTAAISTTESSSPEVLLTRTDTIAVSVSETSSSFGTLDTVDSGFISIAESRTQSVTLSATDTASIATVETTSFTNTVTSTESVAITATDLSVVNNGSNPGGTEAIGLIINETTALLKTIPTTDTSAISVSDASAAALSSTRTDTAAITVTESSTKQVNLASTDTAAISVAETRTQSATFSATDTGAISITETTATSRSLVASDSAAITIVESRLLVVSKVAVDSGSISVSESTGLNIVAGPPYDPEDYRDVTDFAAPQMVAVHYIPSTTITEAPVPTRELVEVYA